MKRYEMWRMQYRARRYMEHLTEQELEQRVRDVLLNQMVLTEENKIGLPPINGEGEYWMIMWTHLLEEFLIRYGPYPAGFNRGFIKDLKIPDPRSPLASKACAEVKRLQIVPDKYVFKYGKFKWLEQIYNEGVIRISPAAFYNDPSLNPAIQDEELELFIQPHPSEIKLEVIDPKTGKSKGFISPIGDKITKKSETNYYVYCMSSVWTPRLFLDFDAETCLIIKKPNIFFEKTLTAFEKQNLGWVGTAKKVTYLDPLNSTLKQIDIFSYKHFRFSYQKEIRLIWLPPKSVKELDHQYLELGSLRDCCELVKVN